MLFGLLRAPRERAAALPMAEARMHAQPGARRRTPCARCAVVLLQIKAASALSEEAGLPGRETGVRECARVGLTEQQCLQQRRARAGRLVCFEGGRASAVFRRTEVSFDVPLTRRCRVLTSPEAASYQLSLQPLRQLHAVNETPPIATAAAQDGLAIWLRTTARSASELRNERQVLRVLASAHAAALNTQRASYPETAPAALR